jgi:hypothetical protein
LEYEPGTKPRRRWRLPVLFSILLILAGWGSWRWFGRIAWGRVQVLYWQSQCLQYQPAPGQFAGAPPFWAKYHIVLPADENFMGGTQIFLHQLVSPHGTRRLVALYMRPNVDHSQLCSIDATVIDPADFWRGPKCDRRTVEWIDGWSNDVKWNQLNWATIDPADSSHVTFKYDAPEKDGEHFDAPSTVVPTTLNFWLTDAGTVTDEPPVKATPAPAPAGKAADPRSLIFGAAEAGFIIGCGK